MISLKDYYSLLKNHDWFYMMSDDYRWERKGRTSHNLILDLAKTSTEHEHLYDAFSNHYLSVIRGKDKYGEYPLPKEPS